MDDRRTPNPVIAVGAALFLYATLPSPAGAQSTSPSLATAATPATALPTTETDHAAPATDYGLRVEYVGSDESTEPLPLLSAAIEPISLRVIREPEARDRTFGEGLIANNVMGPQRPDNDLRLSDTVWMNVGRNSALLDGGIAAARGVRTDPTRGFATPDRDFDLYDLSLRWATLDPGPLELNLMGGVRAIQSVGGMWRTESLPAGRSARPGFTGIYDEDRSTVAMPVVGGDVRYHLADGVLFSTSAATHSSGSREAFFDIVLETSIDLGEGIGFHAGYQEVRSVFEESGVDEPFRDSGLFARLTIEF